MPLYTPESEGSFTPAFSALTTPPTDVTYGTCTARWVRQGSMVYYELLMNLTSKGTGGVGNVLITGFPFTSRAGNYGAGGNLRCSLVTLPAGYTQFSPRFTLSSNTLQIAIVGSNIAQSFSTWADWANTSGITVSGFYMV